MMKANSNLRDFSVMNLHKLNLSSTKGQLVMGSLSWPCLLGKRGCTTRKREGDLSTPIGSWQILTVYYRPDRLSPPITSLPIIALNRESGWCDAPDDKNYNQAVTLPYPASCESLWRDDHVYDICAVLDYNIMPRKRGFGSAIFFHLTRPDHTPTEGCIAVDLPDMLHILKVLKPNSFITV